MEGIGWDTIAKILNASNHMLNSTLCRNANTVTQRIDKVHMEHISILSYNEE